MDTLKYYLHQTLSESCKLNFLKMFVWKKFTETHFSLAAESQTIQRTQRSVIDYDSKWSTI